MLSHHSEGDEAIPEGCWDGAAHLWDDHKGEEAVFSREKDGQSTRRDPVTPRVPRHSGGSVALPSAMQDPLS